MNASITRLSVVAALMAAPLSLGCGPSTSTIHIHGAVTYAGQPVPNGSIYFEPDTSAGNSGPGSMAIIRGGKYDTSEALGVVGGPHIVRIEGYDGVAHGDNSDGRPLFPTYETTTELPTKSTVVDFDVPKKTK
ncbi:hypothetical protein LOC68_16670 [Blastopirellula sp. JC732]|uniref:Carboxypeptidase regulatory-like domain-containing protein n=1 Tax=Blastopirellula sediminis TaxID=2894196 RepID=A0A9X1SHC8_9BACT|nr:hypothetical protein [Blastopirellula sediminis]MCC9606676.1 hypothetical protein [Blastopirellula sediminis]MCC9630027.1 hypothetical protein [Blastopirellula sediminis]